MEVHQKEQHYADAKVGQGGGGGGCGGERDRLPQWSHVETREFLVIRAELDRSFAEAKRNKLLWAAISARMGEKGFRRTPAQCKSKWKNLVTRYKGSEAILEGGVTGRQFPFHDDVRRILSERAERQLVDEGKKVEQSQDLDEDDGRDVGARAEEQESAKRRKAGERDGFEEVEKVLREFMGWRVRAESRWLEASEAREAERREKETEWRRAMEALAVERVTMERRWREREEARRAREEARAQRQHALVSAILAKLAHKSL